MDLHSAEQDGLLKKYYLGLDSKTVDEPWHANGPNSVSPFVPCASGRIPVALRAARLSSSDVLWDLGCGDGRILHQAAAQYGCRCVGLDIDASCVAEARQRSRDQGVDHLCTFLCANMTAFEPGCLRGANGAAVLGDAAEPDFVGTQFPAPSVVLLFITSHVNRRRSFPRLCSPSSSDPPLYCAAPTRSSEPPLQSTELSSPIVWPATSAISPVRCSL